MPATIELTGLLGLPLKHLALQVAASATFQAVTETDSEAEALDCISVGAADDTAIVPPRAIIRWPDESTIGQISRTGYDWSGSILLTFEFPGNPDHRDSFEDSYIDFCNHVGEVIREVLNLSGTAGYLDVRTIKIGPIGQAVLEENQGAEFFVCHTVVGFVGLP